MNDPVARFRVQEVDPVRHYSKNTFEWLFTDQVPYSRWLRDDSGEFDLVFWITGKPGSGKSTLMRFALEDSRTMSLQPPNSDGQPMAYFFHLRGKSLVQKSLRGMLMELLYQILETHPHSFELIRPIFLRLKLKHDWDVRSLSEAMLQIPHIPPATPGSRDRITLFVDALDENQNQEDNTTLLGIFENLIDTYKSVRGRPGVPVLKICLASRSWPIFQKRLGDDPRIPSFAIHNFTMKDIQDYTRSRLVDTIGIGTSEQRQRTISELSSDIASRAMGVFIWVRVVVNNLYQDITDGTPIESLQSKLQEYPEELDSMYKLTLRRVRREYRPEAMAIFKAVFASHVPLHILQLYTVTLICKGSPSLIDDKIRYPEDLVSWLASRSGGLIHTVDADTTTADQVAEAKDGKSKTHSSKTAIVHVEFIHQTVQDFVRKSLDNSLKMTRKDTWVANVSGSRLLALVVLDRHPPHPIFHNIAKDIFSYIREVEHEEDQSMGQQRALPPHWDVYNLHDFPFRIRDLPYYHPSSSSSFALSHYLDSDPDNKLVQRITDRQSQFYLRMESAHAQCPDLSAFVVTVLQNLYRTTLPARLSALAPDSIGSVYQLLLYIASVGPRLSADGLDRPRMFQHIRTSYTMPPRLGHWGKDRPYFWKIIWDIFPPVNELIEHVHEPPPSLAATLAALKPTDGLDDDTLLAFALALNGEGYEDCLRVKVPNNNRFVELPLSSFCWRFRDTNPARWEQLFKNRSIPHDPSSEDDLSFRFLREVPPVNYFGYAESLVGLIVPACFPVLALALSPAAMRKAIWRSPGEKRDDGRGRGRLGQSLKGISV